jgi:hypothetical protein
VTPAQRFRAWLDGLSDDARRALAARYAKTARTRGLFVVRPDGSDVAIPPILTPSVIERARMESASADAHRILSALVRLTESLMSDPAHERLRARLFGSFTPLEAEGLARTWRDASQLATARVDFLVDLDGRARALEVNATIPAMQGYSDCIAESFLREVARERGLDAARADALVASNGRNTDDLLASLIAHFRRLGGTRDQELTIAIVARRGDAQQGELEHYARRWQTLGHDAFLATPDETHRHEGRAFLQGREPDLIYRHVFARRLDPQGEFAQLCLEPARYKVLNPFASHLEVKGLLALASDAVTSSRFPLDDEERAAIARAVPWTRVLEAGPTSGPDGAPIADLAAFTRGERANLVLKRSWDYGGKSVFLGAELDGLEGNAALKARLQAVTGRATGWDALVDFALADRDAWVVQELVPSARERHLRVDREGPVPRELYVDLSAYTNTGVAPRPAGGAVRASESRIVNILGGGGLAPLVLDDVLDELMR